MACAEKEKKRKREIRGRRTVNVHPPLLKLNRCVDLDIVNAFAKTSQHHAMQKVSEPRCHFFPPVQEPDNLMGLDVANSRFSLKSLRPTCCCACASVVAGSHPRMVLDSGVVGGALRKDTANTGLEDESGLGGPTRW
jgi:hypothetical protein